MTTEPERLRALADRARDCEMNEEDSIEAGRLIRELAAIREAELDDLTRGTEDILNKAWEEMANALERLCAEPLYAHGDMRNGVSVRFLARLTMLRVAMGVEVTDAMRADAESVLSRPEPLLANRSPYPRWDVVIGDDGIVEVPNNSHGYWVRYEDLFSAEAIAPMLAASAPSVPVSKLRELVEKWCSEEHGMYKTDFDCIDDIESLIQQAESGEAKSAEGKQS